MRESKARKLERAYKITKILYQTYPDSRCSLNYKSAHELLVATILSAQCTDHRVNIVTIALFKKYIKPEDFAFCDVNVLSIDIQSCGYHNLKAKSIQGSSLMIVEEFNGKVPDTMEEFHGIPSMVIDTHMIRIMNLLGFTKEKDAKKIEVELMSIFNKKDWVKLTHMIIDHGRKVCIARRPKCIECVLATLCPSVNI